MKILKFGGSSLACAGCIEKAKKIILSRINPAGMAIVLSAMGDTTDHLARAGERAASGMEDYTTDLNIIEKQHIHWIHELIPVNGQSHVISIVKKVLNELEDLTNGIYLTGDLSVLRQAKSRKVGK